MYTKKSDTSVVKDSAEIHFPEEKADFIRSALTCFPVEGKISGSTCKVRPSLWSSSLGRSLLVKGGSLGVAARAVTNLLAEANPDAAPFWLVQETDGGKAFKGEPQEFSVLEDAVRSGALEGFHQVQHRASACWMPFWVAALMQASQAPSTVPSVQEVLQVQQDEATGMDIDTVVSEVAQARSGGTMNPMNEGTDLPDILGEDSGCTASAMDITLEGDAALIVVPDSNVLMNRPANLVRFAQLLDAVGTRVVEGQDNLTFTAKILFPFTVTRELDCMKDPRSGKPAAVQDMCRRALSMITECPFEHRAMRESREELRQILAAHRSQQPGSDPQLSLNNDDCILKTCQAWAEKLKQAGKQYSKVVVVTEDTGMLAKAKHDNLAAIRVRELPTGRAGVAEMLLDRDLLSKLDPATAHQPGPPQGHLRQQSLGRQNSQLASAFGGPLPQAAWGNGLMPDINLANLQTSAPPPSGPAHGSLHSQKSFTRSMIQEQALNFAREKGLRPPHQAGHPLGGYPSAQPSSPHGSLHSSNSLRRDFPDFNRLPSEEQVKLRACLVMASQQGMVDFSSLPDCPLWLQPPRGPPPHHHHHHQALPHSQGMDGLRHLGSGHLGREDPPGGWDLPQRHSGGVEHLMAMNQLPTQGSAELRASSLHSINSQGNVGNARHSSGEMSFGTPPNGPAFEAAGLSRFHPHQQQQGGMGPELSHLQLQHLAQAAGAQQTGAHWQQQPDAASQALQARLFAYQQQQSQQAAAGYGQPGRQNELNASNHIATNPNASQSQYPSPVLDPSQEQMAQLQALLRQTPGLINSLNAPALANASNQL